MAKSELRTPVWADHLTDLVCAHDGIEHRPKVVWSRSRNSVLKTRLVDGRPAHYRSTEGAASSSGVNVGDEIVMRLGSSERDARVAYLHELAHWATGHGHNVWMYAKLFEYLFLFGDLGDLPYALARECRYQLQAALDGWTRFQRLAAAWPHRAQTIVEAITAHPNIGC